jgi:hypothetical protein
MLRKKVCRSDFLSSPQTGHTQGHALQFNPNSAVESKVVSEEQTFRSKDNAFLPLSSGQLSLLFITTLNQ